MNAHHSASAGSRGHRVHVEPSAARVRVVIDGRTVAKTERPVLLTETGLPDRYYVPAADVDFTLFRASGTRTRCPWKGEAGYWSYTAGQDEAVHRDAVWAYPEPLPEVDLIRDCVCFDDSAAQVTVTTT
ncbi:DUF427 domain-containing protein [Streptomyces sp. 549]|uniref:DUF427 domain-containing protein n=1 Tax=Streptomyces sp. 549 TaxID=3049076 RepID=UPI0024C3313E|nr:DUF427 domain-containing protein [Streptomyces sp. 549]MDK1474294.1 DUF427 domain-containing protein [Streptomyces sp. 549]